MRTDVKSVRVTATGDAVPFRTRVRTVQLTGGATAGTLQLRDGASGPVLIELDAPINAAVNVLIPENGVLFDSAVHATLTNLTAATIFYG